MNWNLLTNLFITTLLIGPVAFLLLRFLRGPRFLWWIVIVLSLVVGWGSIIGAPWSSLHRKI